MTNSIGGEENDKKKKGRSIVMSLCFCLENDVLSFFTKICTKRKLGKLFAANRGTNW